MAKLVMYSVRGGQSIDQALTRFVNLVDGSVNFNATEANEQRTTNTPGVLSNLAIRITVNTILASSSFVSRINGANGGQSLTIGSAATGWFEDTTGSDATTTGTVVGAKLITGTDATKALSVGACGAAFAATTNTVVTHGHGSSGNFSTASTTAYAKYVGAGNGWSTTETATQQYRLRTAGVQRRLCVVVTTNARSTTSTVGNRVNGAAGTMLVSPTAGATGQFTDTTHSDAVSAGALVNLYVTLGTGTGNLNSGIFIDHETTDGTTDYIASAVVAVVAGVTGYVGVQGTATPNIATESFAQVKAGVACIASLYQVYVSTYTIVGGSTLTFRVNGADGQGSIALSDVLGTGWLQDITHSDVLVGTEDINWKLVVGGVGTSLTIQYLAHQTTLVVPGTATPSGVSVASGFNAATASGAANVAPTGVSASSGINAPAGSGAGNAAPVGVGVGSGVGTPGGAGAGDVTVAGVTVDTDVGQPTAAGSATAAPAGVGVTTGVGQPTASGNAPTPGYTGGGVPPGPKYQRKLHRPRNPFTHITVTPETDREYAVIRDGVAQPHGVGVRVGVGRPMAWTESFARPTGVSVHAGVGVPQCAGDACASPEGVEVGVSVAYLEPWGVENPSDAALMDWTLGLVDA